MAGTRAEFEGHTGVWVTSRGRHIFIRDGESISESIARYNKKQTGDRYKKYDEYEFNREYGVNKEAKSRSERYKDRNNVLDNLTRYENETGKQIGDAESKINMAQWTGKMNARERAKLIDEANSIYQQELTESYELTNNNPIQSMADDRIDDVETTLENNKWILDYMNNNGIDDFGGESKQDLEYKIARDEEYLKTAKASQSDKITISKDDIANKIAENNKKEAELISRGQTLYTTADKIMDDANNKVEDYLSKKNPLYKNEKGTEARLEGNSVVFDKYKLDFKNEDDAKAELQKYGYDNYELGNYNPMEEFSDTVGDGLSDLQRNAMNKNANEDKLKEIYTMDRVLRGLNDEDGLYESGWLMNGVADEETDFGYDEFKSSSEKINHPGEYYYVDDYDDLKKMYKSIMDEYAESGIVSRRAYEGKDGYKENAGLTDEEIAYAKKDFPNIPVYGKGWAIEKETKDDSNEIGFVQEDSMYGGVIKEYTNKELREMAERGIRPRKDSYGHPGAWEGINSDKGLSNKEIAKTVQDAMKKKYPNTKLSRSTAGYDNVEITISSSSEPIIVSNDDIDKMEFSDFGNLSTSNGFDRWAKENVEGYSKRATYDINDVRNFAKTQLKDEFKGTSVSGNEWYLTSYGKNLVSDIQKELNSYNYDDSNGMVDYFNSGFYDDIKIGKWNKPYEDTSYNKSTLTNENDEIKAKVERFKKRKGKK